MNLRVLTYNIHGGKGTDGKRDYERIGRLFKEYRVDVALLQEVEIRSVFEDPNHEISALQSDHFDSFVAAPTRSSADGWFGNAVLSRFPILKKNVIDVSEAGREPRNILEVFVKTAEGSLHLVTTHKGLSWPERRRQIQKLHATLTRKNQVPLLVGGDINVWHFSGRTFQELNQTLHPLPAGATYPTPLPVLHLDRMWCRPSKLVQSVYVLKTPETRIYSDHYPVMAEICLPLPKH